MDFSYNEEQQAMLDLAKQILADQSTHERLKKIEHSGGPRFDRDLWADVAKAGLLGLGIPEEQGGSGFGFLEIAGVVEEVGRTTAPIPFLETMVCGALPIATLGTDAQRAAWLPRIAAGDAVVAGAFTESLGGPRDPSVTAEPVGDAWQIRGEKFCVPYAEVADLMVVSAKTAAGGVGLFLVDPTGDGVAIEALDTTSGMPEARVEFSSAPATALGAADEVGADLDWVLERYSAALASLSLGVCQEALRLTAEYTTNRKQFGQPIASFQAAGHRAADAYVDTEAIRLTTRQANWRLSAGLPAGKEVAVARLYAADSGHRVVHAAQHLHGGMGVDRDYPLHRYFLYARQIELTLGHGTEQLRRLGRMLAE